MGEPHSRPVSRRAAGRHPHCPVLEGAVKNRNVSQFAVPIGVIGIIVMMVVPLPTFLLDLLHRAEHHRRPADPAGQHVRAAAAGLLGLPRAAAGRHAVPARAQHQRHPAGAARRLRRQGDRRVRQLRGRRLPGHRPGHLPDPGHRPDRRGHQGRRAGRRGRRPVHPRRDARQADGDRRRPQRRPDRRGRGASSAAPTSPPRPTSTARWTVARSSSRATRSPPSSSR